MYFKIKNRIEKELASFGRQLNKEYSLNGISPQVSGRIKEFIQRKGKRLRPILFAAGYLGFAKKAAPGLYKAALSFEILHDFLIVHDDIIDKSDMRRGRPSMHKAFNAYLSKRNAGFDGEDLALVIGDIMFAMAVRAFLSIKEDPSRKEEALKRFLASAVYTGCGEFTELLCGIKNIEDITMEDIYKIYDLKTAYYSFAYPLSTGAALAGAEKKSVKKLFNCGMHMGRAFQIKDDILGLFGDEKKTGKPALTDLAESKKTILIWRLYNNSGEKDRTYIKNVLSGRIGKSDLLRMRKIMIRSGALDYAKNQIADLIKKADGLLAHVDMRPPYKAFLRDYARKLLKN